MGDGRCRLFSLSPWVDRVDVLSVQPEDINATDVDAFVRDNVETDRVSLEQRGPRTYLVLEE